MRIETVLSKDPVISPKLGKKTIEIMKRGQKVLLFAPEVVEVAKAMAKDNLDPCDGVPKVTILSYATKLIFGGTTNPQFDMPSSSTVPDSETEPTTASAMEAKANGRQNFSIYCLARTQIHIAKQYDKQPGHAERLALLEQVATEFSRTLTS